MADEVEKVEYIFEGDVSSLRDSTTKAIKLLEQFSSAMGKTASSDAFKASKSFINSFNSAVKSTIAQVNSFVKAFNSIDPQMASTLAKQLPGVSSGMEKLGSILGELANKADSTKSKLSDLGSTIKEKFKSLVPELDPMLSKMESLKSVSSNISGAISGKLGEVASAFRRVAQSEDSANSATNKTSMLHKALSGIMDKLTSSAKEETEAVSSGEEKLDEKNDTVEESKGKHLSLLSAVSRLGSAFSSESSSIGNFSNTLKKLGTPMKSLQNLASTIAGVQLGDWLAQGAKSAIDYTENLNLFTVAMGDSVDVGLEFVNQMQEIYGMDPSNLYETAGYFYQLTDAIGIADSASASMSLSLTKAANDIASLYNVDVDTVVENLASGMQGMSVAVRKYGMDIRAATLQETAAQYGLTQQVESMSEANRMALRYITMMDQVSNALHQTTEATDGSTEELGDFARNIETPANQLRIFKEQISQLGRAIGNFIVVPLTTAISYINGFIMALRSAIDFVAGALGVLSSSVSRVDTSGADAATDSVEGIGDAASGAAQKLKELSAPFDELNVLQQESSSGSGSSLASDDVLDPALAAALEEMELKLDNVSMKANKVRDALLEFFGFKVEAGEILSWDSSSFEQNLIEKFPQWTQTIEAAFSHWGEIVEGFKNLFKSLWSVIEEAGARIESFFSLFISDNSVSGFIEGLGGALNRLSTWIGNNSGLLVDLTAAVLGVVSAIATFSKVTSVLSTISKLASGLSLVLGAANPLTLVIMAVIAAIVLLVPYCDSLQELLSSIWNTVSVIWEDVKTILADIGAMVSRIWENTIQPIVTRLVSAINKISDVLNTLWEDFLGPIIEKVSNRLTELWTEALGPFVEKVLYYLGRVIEYVLLLWENILLPWLNWVLKYLLPTLRTAIGAIFDFVVNIIKRLIKHINSIIDICSAVVDFITGVLSGDWERAWKGLVNIFIGIANLIIDAFEGAINFLIDLVNLGIAAIYGAFQNLVNGIGGLIEEVADFFGADINLRITGDPPAIGSVSIPRIPQLAKGGVVTSPTYLLAGEGRYDEAIVPLGNSPQMEELVQRIADAVDDPRRSSADTSPIEVHVFIGGDEYDVYTYRASERGRKKIGAQPITVGG